MAVLSKERALQEKVPSDYENCFTIAHMEIKRKAN
jgi:hypothetical protein